MTKKDGKPCKRCGTSAWYKSEACKICKATQRKKWAEENPERTREFGRNWDNTNREKRRLWDKERYATNPQKYIEKNRKWCQENKERRRKYARERYRSNPEVRAVKRRWQQENPQKTRNYDKRKRKQHKNKIRFRINVWRKNNPGKRKEYYHRREARKTEAGGSFTAYEWKTLCEHYNYRCLSCGKQFPIEKLTFDHVIPVSRGGTSNIDNGQPLCKSCNSSKGAKTTDYRHDAGPDRWVQNKLF